MKYALFVLLFSVLAMFFSCKPNRAFLDGIDFNQDGFALYIKHKQFGEFIVTDKKALKANKKRVKLKVNPISYLPGEGDRSYGATLFKHHKKIKQKTAGVFSEFTIGNLKDFGQPAEVNYFYGTQKQCEAKMAELRQKEDIYFIRTPQFLNNNLGF